MSDARNEIDEPVRTKRKGEKQLALEGRIWPVAPERELSKKYRRARLLAPVGTPDDDPLIRNVVTRPNSSASGEI